MPHGRRECAIEELLGAQQCERGALTKELKAAAGTRTVWTSSKPWVALSGSWDQAQGADKQQAVDELDGRPSREANQHFLRLLRIGPQGQDPRLRASQPGT